MDNTELFTGKAEAYAKARPGYSIEAIQYIRALISDQPVIAEIGAGTGIFTHAIAQFATKIFAVEPNSDMRAQLRETVKEFNQVTVVDATAENTTLPDHCADAIVCAQALHWFDLPAFNKECQRIGKADAVVIAVYNNLAGGDSSQHSATSTKAFFGLPTIKEFANPIQYTREQWLTYMTTHSKDPLPDSAAFAEHMEQMNQVFESESENGILTRMLHTSVYHKKLSDL